jgi:uncharacterized membrane protein YhaH (DUF805 family)
MFVLFSIIVSIALTVIGNMIHLPIIATLYSLAVLLPSVAVGIRRMHDTDHSGWWIIVPLVNLIFACTDGTPSSNRFGPSPKAIAA